MKKWIALIACSLSIIPYSLQADSALPPQDVVERITNAVAVAPEQAPVGQTPQEQTPPPPPQEEVVDPEAESEVGRVGKAPEEDSHTGRSTVIKYLLAATAVAIAVTALILVKRHGGHHSHHHKKKS